VIDPIRHLYAMPADIKSWIGGSTFSLNTASDPDLLRLCNWASRRIDDYCGRHVVGPRIDTRHYDLGWGGLRNDTLVYTRLRYLPSWDRPLLETATVIGGTMSLSDWLLNPTGVTVYTDSNESTSFSYLRAIPGSAQYIANPNNYAYWCEPEDRKPYRWLKLNELGSNFVYGGQRTLHIAGEWGWQDKQYQITDLNGSLDGVTTTVVVDDPSKCAIGKTLVIDGANASSEQMYVTGVSGASLTVERGVNGTTAVAHNDEAIVTLYEYPMGVIQAAIDLCRVRWRRRELGKDVMVADPQMGVMLQPSKEEIGILHDLDSPFRASSFERGSF
jgi:hypothetical protein